MISGFGLLSIDDHMDRQQPAAATKDIVDKRATIATNPTGELTPSGSLIFGEDEPLSPSEASGELTRTLSALQRLSLEDQTTLRRKLGQQQQHGSCRDLSSEYADKSKPVSKSDDAVAVVADSPYRVVLQKAVVEGDLEAATAALFSGADPNERDDLRHSSLHFAAAKGDISCLRELMKSGARANVANNVRSGRIARCYCCCCMVSLSYGITSFTSRPG